ncbi:MAG: ATP-binding protein [Bacteroidota bacterium]
MDPWQEPQTLATYLLIVLLFVLILISAIIIAVKVSIKKTFEAKEKENNLKLEHQQKLLENSVLIQERERARIAADIHDELIGKLTAIKMTNQLRENTKALDDLISSSIKIARRISHDLMPPLIEYSSLEEIIKETVRPWQNQLAINMLFNGTKDLSISAKIKLHIVRIIQEILVNIDKHSNADLTTISLRISPHWISLVIEDNGIGFDRKRIKNGLGLSNIETRLQYIKGRYKLKSVEGKGTKYIILIPTVLDVQEG